MTQPPGAFLAPAEPQQRSLAQIVEPTAVAQAQPSAVFALGEVLKFLIHNSRAFHTENAQDDAMNTVDKFVRAFTTSSDMQALSTGEERAAKEDVTLRTPPGGAPAVSMTGPAINYAALAKALLDEQERRGITQ